MAEDEILRELRAIRILLTIDHEEQVKSRLADLSEIQREILDSLDFEEWMKIDSGEIGDELNVGESTVREHRSELVSWGFVEKKGEKRWAEYRKTVLAEAAELLF